jgi:hypothetical protein
MAEAVPTDIPTTAADVPDVPATGATAAATDVPTAVATDALGFQMYPDGDARNKAELESREDRPVPPRPVVPPKANSAVKIGNRTAKMAIKSNKTRQVRGLPSDIVVINERVQLDETDFEPYDGGNIGFTAEYFPNNIKTPNEIIAAKIVFAKVFKEGSGFSVENPQAPCDENEYGILREGLQNRLERIRTEVRLRKKDEGGSVRVIGLMDQGIRIQKLLDNLDENEKNECTEYKNTAKDKAGFGMNTISNINDDQMRRLIRNFSFLVLQAMNPIEEYDKFAEVDPVDLVNILDNPNFTESNMNQYLAEYQEQFQVPRLIATILSGTGSQKAVLDLMLEKEKKKLLEFVKDSVKNTLPEGADRTTFEVKLAEIQGEDAKSQIVSVLDWIVNRTKAAATATTEASKELIDLRAEKDLIKGRLAELEETHAAVSSNLATSKAEALALAPAAGSSAAATAENSKNRTRITELEEQLRLLQEKLDLCKGDSLRIEQSIAKTDAGIPITKRMYDALETIIAASEREIAQITRESEGFEARVQALTREKEAVDTELAELKTKTPLAEQAKASLIARSKELTAKSRDYQKNLNELAAVKAAAAARDIELRDSKAATAAATEAATAAAAEKAAFESRLAALASESEGLRTQIEALNSGNNQAAAAASAEVNAAKARELAALTDQLSAKDAEIATLRGEIAGNASIAASAIENIRGSTDAKSADADRIVRIAKMIVDNKDDPAIQTEIANLGSDESRASFNKLLVSVRAGQEQTSDSTDVCYLNYFVGFFMRELSISNNLKQEIIAEVAKNSDNTMLDKIFTTLKADKIDDDVCSFFSTVKPNIPDTSYQQKFRNFYERVKGIKYDAPCRINPVGLGLQARPNKVTYLGVFTYFLFFARKYLIENKDKLGGKCTISETDFNGPSVEEATRDLTVQDTLEAAPVAAPAAAPTPAPASRPQVPKPNTVSIYENSNTKTMLGILNLISQSGSGKAGFEKIMSNATYNENLPIVKFINKYRAYDRYFKGIKISTIDIDKLKDNDDSSIPLYNNVFTKIYSNINKFKLGDPKDFIKDFVLEFFKVYVSQYNLDGQLQLGLEVEAKAKKMIVWFKKFIGNAIITIIFSDKKGNPVSREQSVYDLTGLNDEAMIRHVISSR